MVGARCLNQYMVGGRWSVVGGRWLMVGGLWLVVLYYAGSDEQVNYFSEPIINTLNFKIKIS